MLSLCFLPHPTALMAPEPLGFLVLLVALTSLDELGLTKGRTEK